MNKHPTKVDELPAESFYAILYPDSVTIPGDERSRTNPGHGYPEHSVNYWRMEVFPNKEAWSAEVEMLSRNAGYGRREFKAVRIVPAKVTTAISVSVEDA